MPFARQVSIGRVALVQYPEAEAGKLVVISDVVSPNAVSLGAPQWLHLCSRAMQRAFGRPWQSSRRTITCSMPLSGQGAPCSPHGLRAGGGGSSGGGSKHGGTRCSLVADWKQHAASCGAAGARGMHSRVLQQPALA